METPRFLLLISLGLVSTMIYTTWINDYGQSKPNLESTGAATSPLEQDVLPSDVPSLSIDKSLSPSPANKEHDKKNL